MDQIKKNQTVKPNRITVSLSQDTLDLLEQIAKKYAVTKSSAISILITKYATQEFALNARKES